MQNLNPLGSRYRLFFEKISCGGEGNLLDLAVDLRID